MFEGLETASLVEHVNDAVFEQWRRHEPADVGLIFPQQSGARSKLKCLRTMPVARDEENAVMIKRLRDADAIGDFVWKEPVHPTAFRIEVLHMLRPPRDELTCARMRDDFRSAVTGRIRAATPDFLAGTFVQSDD